MNLVVNPKREQWDILCKRASFDSHDLSQIVKTIMEEVKTEGDKAVLRYTRKFDYPDASSLLVSREMMSTAAGRIKQEVKEAIELAISNIDKFHQSQAEFFAKVETIPGVECWRRSVPIERVGLYIPGGTAPLFSTLIMLAVPAKIAGCKEIVVCTPPDKSGRIADEILYVSERLKLNQIRACGGAQAIAAMTFGTECIPKVDKIFGPGNQYVTEAKLQAQRFGVAIDLPAGPSEVLVIAEKGANPSYVASDLLSQAEHGGDSQVILLTDSPELAKDVTDAIDIQLQKLPRKSIAQAALKNSRCIVFKSREEMISFSNQYAPEHLIIHSVDHQWYEEKITNAGSVFLGAFTPESAGDYASGTNHTLPTNGYARVYSGVSLDSFVKKITFQHITEGGLKQIGPAIVHMARAEQLEAHAMAVEIRLKALYT